MSQFITRLFLGVTVVLVATLAAVPPAFATVFTSNGPIIIHGIPLDPFWNDTSGWTPAGVPSALDTASFSLPSNYGVILGTSPTISNLNDLAGNVALYSSGGVQTLSVNYRYQDVHTNAFLGTPTVSLSNPNGNTSLTLGAISTANAVNLVIDNLAVQGGAVLIAQLGSQITIGRDFNGDLETPNPIFSSTFNGLVIIDGSGSRLIENANKTIRQQNGLLLTTPYLMPQNVGTAAGTGELLFENSSTGSSTAGPLLIANDGTSADGSVVLVSGSTLSVAGDIKLATNGSAGAPTALLEINSANSALTQTEYIQHSIGLPDQHIRTQTVVGSAGFGTATVNVGTVVSGSALTTDSTLTINKTGTVNVGSSTTTGTLNSNGNVTINGGALLVGSGSMFNWTPGYTLTINGGTADFKSYNPNGRNVNFIAGSLSYAGNLLVGTGGLLGINLTLDGTRQLSLTGTTTVDPTRTFVVTGGTLNTGALVNNGYMDLTTGTLNTGTATLSAGSTLEIDLGGISRNTQYGAMDVSGSIGLGGSLLVTDSFSPAVGNFFHILAWGTHTGVFSSMQLPSLAAGRVWDTSQLYTMGVISVAATGLSVDYNHNGIVDGADYVVWRKGLGPTYSQADYDAWRMRFGLTGGSGSDAIANSAVPEPTTDLLLLFVSSVCGIVRRRT